MKRLIFTLAIPALMLSAAVFAADVKLDGITCVVAAKNPAKADKTVDYKGGKLFFCCPNCPNAFSKDPAKFATKANVQLAATGQAKQESCPFSGQPINPDSTVTISGVKVGFCCDDCKGKAADAEPAKQVEMVFADKPFDKAFKVAK